MKNDERRERLEERSVLPRQPSVAPPPWAQKGFGGGCEHSRIIFVLAVGRGGQLCIINCSSEQNLCREPPRTVDELGTPSIVGKNLPSVFAITPTRFSTGQFQVRGVRASDCVSAGDAPSLGGSGAGVVWLGWGG